VITAQPFLDWLGLMSLQHALVGLSSQQTINHMGLVDSCLLTKLKGGLCSLHEANDDEVQWLENKVTAALAQ